MHRIRRAPDKRLLFMLTQFLLHVQRVIFFQEVARLVQCQLAQNAARNQLPPKALRLLPMLLRQHSQDVQRLTIAVLHHQPRGTINHKSRIILILNFVRRREVLLRHFREQAIRQVLRQQALHLPHFAPFFGLEYFPNFAWRHDDAEKRIPPRQHKAGNGGCCPIQIDCQRIEQYCQYALHIVQDNLRPLLQVAGFLLPRNSRQQYAHLALRRRKVLHAPADGFPADMKKVQSHQLYSAAVQHQKQRIQQHMQCQCYEQSADKRRHSKHHQQQRIIRYLDERQKQA